MQTITWEIVTSTNTATTFGYLLRCPVKGGWLVTDEVTSTNSNFKAMLFIADPTGAWNSPTITWEIVYSTPKTPVVGATYRAHVPGGWIVANIIGGDNSSRTLVFLPDSTGEWLKDPTPAPTPVPPPPSPAKWLGTNLMEVRDWSTDYPFVNHMFKSRNWLINAQFGSWTPVANPVVDSQGNLLSLASGQVARCVMFTSARPQVPFDLTWTGSGSISIFGATVSSTAANHITFTPAASGNTWFELTNVDAANPPKNFSLKRSDQASVTGLFNPDFLVDMKKYACIRFMDWTQANYNRTAAQITGDFAPLSSLPIRFTDDGQGVPLSVQIELCNQAKVNGWFCININADTTSITQFLTQIKSQLDPTLKAYVELGNEPWNTANGFNTNKLLPGNDFTAKLTAYANKAADLAAQVASILGTQGISILGSQDTATWWQEQLILIIKNAGKRVPDCLAIAPYFGLGVADATTSFDDGSLLASANKEISWVQQSVAIAKKYGIQLICYEGGCSVLPGSVVNRDARIGSIYSTYLAGIKAALASSGILFNHYAYCSQYGASGSWGEKEFEYQSATAKSTSIANAM